MRERVEARLGRTLERLRAAADPGSRSDAHRRARAAAGRALLRRRSRAPRAHHRRPADRRRRSGGGARRRRPADAPAEPHPHRRARRASRRDRRAARRDRLPAGGATACAASSIACTGEPHCNFSVTETKTRLDRLVQRLEERFGDDVADAPPPSRRLPARLRPALGRRPRLPGHDRARTRPASAARRTTSSCAAALGPGAAIGRPLFRRVPTERARRRGRAASSRGWLDGRGDGERLPRVLRPLERRRARRAGRPASRREPRERRDEAEAAMSTDRPDRRAARPASSSIEFEGEEPQDAARVGARALLAADRALHRVPGRRRRAARHGVRDRPGDPASSPSTPAACRTRPTSWSSSCASATRAWSSSCSRPTRARAAAGRPRTGPNLFYATRSSTGCSAATSARCSRSRGTSASLDAWITGLRRDQWATPHEHPQGRDRPRPRRRSSSSTRSPSGPRTRSGTTCASTTSRTTRSTTSGYTSIGCAPCTRAIAPGRARARRPLVVGDERAQGVRHPLRDRDRRLRARAARDARRDDE